MSADQAEKDRASALDPALVARWRAEAKRIGGVPDDHPNVPPEYVYTANRLVALIDHLDRLASVSRPAGGA